MSQHHTVRTLKGKKVTFLVGEDNPQYVPLKDIMEIYLKYQNGCSSDCQSSEINKGLGKYRSAFEFIS